MGWGTRFICNVDFNKKSYDNAFQLDDEIKETEEMIKLIREYILMYCSSNIKDITTEDWKEQPIEFIHSRVSGLIDDILEKQGELMKLYLAQENFDSKINI